MNATSLLAMVATRSRCAPILVALLAAGAAGEARGDWLVLASGEQIETKGPWKLEGQKVVFTSTRGVLSSVRASSVNVESSRTLTARKLQEAAAVVVATPVPKREPVLVLTDADFATPRPPLPEGAVVVPAGEARAEAAETAGAPVVVPAADTLETRVAQQMPGPPAVKITSWSVRPTGEDQISLFGTVENVGRLVAAAITVDVKLIDSEGAQVGATEAAVSTTALMPAVHADFEARFPGNTNFAAVEFTVDTVELEIGRPNGAPAEGAAPEGSAAAAGTASEGATAAPSEGATAGAASAPARGRRVLRPTGSLPSGDEPHSEGAAEQPELD
jgi:hypothetical protein